ncbi:MAG: YdjY domain-containing protein [Verrucomicrobiota bacterium]
MKIRMGAKISSNSNNEPRSNTDTRPFEQFSVTLMLFLMLPIRSFTVLIAACAFSVGKADPGERERPAVTQIGEHLYRLGDIKIDAKKREISFPVVVNMREGGPIEYLLVHEHGKVHESILTTSISPLNLQIALKLLKFDPGYGDVFNLLLTPELLEKEGGTKEERGDSMEFSFLPEGKGQPVHLPDLIMDGFTQSAMKGEPWIYTGSRIENGVFMAESEGSIIAIYLDHLALFNMTIDGADTDERWGANPELIPEIGTAGTLSISAAEF